jgi:transcriptional regulator with XRE-family HTH domain
MLADTIKGARERRGWSQRELALAAGVSRKHISDLESGANVSVKVVEKLAGALGLADIPISGGAVLRPGISDRTPNVVLIRDRITRILRGANEVLEEISNERGRVLRYQEPQRPRILFDEDQAGIDSLKGALQKSPNRDAEWRSAFKGRGRHKVARFGDAAAGAGAEPVNFLDEEDVLLREIPEHYWELGARMVLRVRGDSLAGLGYVDRDLLFIRPSLEASNNDVVVCTYRGLVYVKVLRRSEKVAWLLSANDGYAPIQIEEAEHFRINGVVVGRSGYALPGSQLPDP